MLLNSFPLNPTLLHMVLLWIAASLIGSLIVGLGLLRRKRIQNKQWEKLIEMRKDAATKVSQSILTRAK